MTLKHISRKQFLTRKMFHLKFTVIMFQVLFMTSKYYFIMQNGYEAKTIKFYIACPTKWFLQVPNDNDIYRHHASRDILLVLPMRGTASDVVGIDSATRFRNTVSDSSIVISEMNTLIIS